MADLIMQDEVNAKDETYTKPVMRGDGQVVDPGATHVIKDTSPPVGQSLDPSVSSYLSLYSPTTLFVDPSF